MKTFYSAILACIVLISCDDSKRDPEQRTQETETDKEPVTLVFRASDPVSAKLLPHLAEAYKRENSHVSFATAPESEWSSSTDNMAQFLSSGGIVMTTRKITEDERQRLEARMIELKEK